MAATRNLSLNFKKSTKGTHVFDSEELGILGVYIPRALCLPGVAPEDTEVTVVITAKSGVTAKASRPVAVGIQNDDGLE